MKSIQLSMIPVLFCCMIAAAFIATDSALAGDVFKWNDNAGSDNWVASGNWNQDPGSGDYPGEDQNDDQVHLYHNFTGSLAIDLTTGTIPSSGTITIANLLVSTDNSADQWVLSTGAQTSPLLKVSSEMGFLLQNNGAFSNNVDLGFVDARITVGVKGGTAIFKGKLIGGSGKTLDASTTSIVVDGTSQITGGTLQLAASNNDGFTGTVDVGHTKVNVAQINGLRNATVNLIDLNNRYSYADNALLGALTGTKALTLVDRLRVGNKNTDVSYTGAMSGSGSLYKKGTGIWTLGGASTHTGTTYIDAGKIKLSNGLALQNSLVWLNVNNGLNINGNDTTIGGLGGTGALALGGNSLTIRGSGDYLHLGIISGSGGIIIDMNGSQDFGPNNTYSGGTLLFGGTLKSGSSGDLGATSGALTIGPATFQANGTHTQTRELKFAFNETLATLSVDSGKTLTWSGLISDPSANQTIRKLGAGTLVINNNANSYLGNFLINEGTVAPSASGLALTRIAVNTDNGLDISSGATTIGSLNGSGSLILKNDLTIGNHPNSGGYSGALSQVGAKTLTKIGTTTQTFSGTSTRNGPTVVNGGTLILDNLTETPIGSGLITVNSGATLSGNGVVGSSVTVNSGGMITASSSSASLALKGTTIAGTFICAINGSNATRLDSEFGLTLTGGTLDLNGTPTQPAYILLTYGTTLTGTFATVLDLPSGYKIDYAFNGNSVALVEDTTAPTLISFTTLESSPSNADSITFAITFSEEVTNVDASDFIVTYAGGVGTATLTGSGFSYALTIPNITGDGVLQVSLGASSGIIDAAGNELISSAVTSSVTIDNTAPQVAITTTESSPTNADTISYTCVFTEAVVGFNDYTDFYFTGTTAAGTDITTSTVVNSGDDQTFTVTLNDISGDGLLQYRLRGFRIKDAAGNKLIISIAQPFDPFSPGRIIDNTVPVIELNGDGASVSLDIGDSWSDPVTATDTVSNVVVVVINVTVIIGGDTVNTAAAGIYALTYDATDSAGNAATQLTRTVTVRTAYLSWSLSKGLTEGVNDGEEDNPDGDQWNNRDEYALDGDPLDSTNNGKVAGGLANVNGTNYLVHTFPALDGTSFAGTPGLTGTNDIVVYLVSGSTNLFDFDEIVFELSPALTNSMPALNSGWGYHTFLFHESTATEPKAFIKLKIESSSL